eukprot:Em1129g1a
MIAVGSQECREMITPTPLGVPSPQLLLLTMKVYFEGFPARRADMALQPLTACVLSLLNASDGFDAVSVQNVSSHAAGTELQLECVLGVHQCCSEPARTSGLYHRQQMWHGVVSEDLLNPDMIFEQFLVATEDTSIDEDEKQHKVVAGGPATAGKELSPNMQVGQYTSFDKQMDCTSQMQLPIYS